MEKTELRAFLKKAEEVLMDLRTIIIKSGRLNQEYEIIFNMEKVDESVFDSIVQRIMELDEGSKRLYNEIEDNLIDNEPAQIVRYMHFLSKTVVTNIKAVAEAAWQLKDQNGKVIQHLDYLEDLDAYYKVAVSTFIVYKNTRDLTTVSHFDLSFLSFAFCGLLQQVLHQATTTVEEYRKVGVPDPELTNPFGLASQTEKLVFIKYTGILNTLLQALNNNNVNVAKAIGYLTGEKPETVRTYLPSLVSGYRKSAKNNPFTKKAIETNISVLSDLGIEAKELTDLYYTMQKE